MTSAPDRPGSPMTAVPTSSRRWWPLVFISGLGLWALSILTYQLTRDTTIVPSIIFVGSFLIPVSFMVWVVQREQFTGANPQGEPSALTMPLLTVGMIGGGLATVVLSALIESLALHSHPALYYPGVAIIEETVKFLAVLVLARHLQVYYLRDGMALGATVGFGFAAFESAGYGFSALMQSPNGDVMTLVESELVRGLLSPMGHGLWTALVGGALFAAARNGRLRITARVIGWLLVAIVLHMLWDLASGLAIILTYLTTGNPVNLQIAESGRFIDPGQVQIHLEALFTWSMLTLCAVIGLLLTYRMWRRGRAVVGLGGARTAV